MLGDSLGGSTGSLDSAGNLGADARSASNLRAKMGVRAHKTNTDGVINPQPPTRGLDLVLPK
eukprot:5366134-Alexandrium_andersonii.AAC.1